jgi:hypothetical protein
MIRFIVSALAIGGAFSSQAFADQSCRADLVTRNGQVVSSSIGDGFTLRQACQNALSQCQDDLDLFQSQGRYPRARCVVADTDGPVFPVPPVPPGPGPFPPGPGPFPPGPGPFPPGPGPFPPGPGPFPPGPDGYQEISCSSVDHQVNYCYVGNWAYAVRLVQQFSSASCRQNVSFGLTGEYVWVDRGCRGVFGVYSR